MNQCQKSKNESNELINQLQSAHQSPNKMNSSKSPSSPHLLNRTPTYHQDVNTNTSGANKNSCETIKNIPEPENLQSQIRNKKQEFVENLNNGLNIKDLNELFGLETTNYLKENCSTTMHINRKTGKNKGIAFVFSSEYAHNELLKLLNLMALNSMERVQFSKRHCPQENEETYCNKNNKVFLIGDSHLNRINKENFRKEFKGDWVYFKCFPGANTKQLDYYSIPMLVDEKANTTVIHIGSNDTTKSNYRTINADELTKGIVNIGLKFKYYGVCQIAISSVPARSTNDLNKVIKQVNVSLRSLCKVYGFAFICNENIDRNRL